MLSDMAGSSGRRKEFPVDRTRRSRRGFTLTEILMAVGILGVGMTMVGSIFPVAVDQSRRSRETTMAAECARSIAATIRAERDAIMPRLRADAKDQTRDITGYPELPIPFRVYNPDAFLYDWGRAYATNSTTGDMTLDAQWQAGNYVPVVLATPVKVGGTDIGPWRITILIYKARGTLPVHLNTSSTGGSGNYMKNWTVNRALAGSYLIDWQGATSTTGSPRGEAYLIDNIVTPTSGGTINWANGSIYLAPVVTNTAAKTQAVAGSSPSITGSTGLPSWVSMPGAIAAFHTIIGD
jgi:prepilin-type N-terminal cleavage/methylation domain-containing protein